jgi:hypothetical protein
MKSSRDLAQGPLTVLLILGFVVFPIAIGATPAQPAHGQSPPVQIDFTPHVTPALITPTPPFSGLGPLEGGPVTVEGGFLRVGSAWFPIGCEFEAGGLIPTGSTTQSATGLFGYATIQGAPEYRLIWYTVPGTWYAHGGGERRYLIVRADDPLFSGFPNLEDGFQDYVDAALQIELAIGLGGVGAGGGLGAAWLAGALACPGTACLSLLVATGAAVITGGITAAFNVFRWAPAARNAAAQFHTIALECNLPTNPLP